jgi:sarcosine oxidase
VALAADFDAIVIGAGGVGSATLWQLAARGARVLGLDRFPIAHDRGSSHGHTRMIRTAYFEHPDYVPLVRLAYGCWDELSQTTNSTLLRQTGLLEVGPADGFVVPGVLAAAAAHDLSVERLSAREAEERFRGFRVPDEMAAVVEPDAGLLYVEDCIRACAAEATRLGADLRTGEEVRSWQADGAGVVVETKTQRYRAGRLIITAGAWAVELLSDLRVPLAVRRKPLYWYAASEPAYRAEEGCPGFLYELPNGVFYGLPAVDPRGVKLGEHSGGRPVSDPLHVDRSIDVEDQRAVEQFAAAYLPGVTTRCTDHTVCLYTMTPDAHFIIDRHPAHPHVVFAAGLSGHGFKFAPVLGQALAELALDGATSLPIGFLKLERLGLR